jgi:glycine/D-amino acid oxidase-like deaminating enzyme
MDLRSGQAFWPLRSGIMANYPRLENDIHCEVAIIGGGVTGALIADVLTRYGADVVILDKRDVARGSTSASTALLQYEIDTHLSDLIDMVGRDHAERAYRLCLEAIDKLEALTERLPERCGFERKKSLYYASSKKDAKRLATECEARKQAGFAVAYWDQQALTERFSFSAPGAIYSQDGAQVDAYRLAHRLLMCVSQRGGRIFDRTEVTESKDHLQGITLMTAEGCQVTAKKVVYASGYETQQYLKDEVVQLKSSYALVSEPLTDFPGWHERCLIWESARPYLYLRTTEEGRVLVGGEDLPFRNVVARDRLMSRKQARLEQKFSQLFPDIPLQTAYTWAGTFGETKDGLAYIGEHHAYPHAYFALGYGGNGITYSMVAAEIICDLYLGNDNNDRHIFRFGR